MEDSNAHLAAVTAVDLTRVTGGGAMNWVKAGFAGWMLANKMYGHDHNLPGTGGWIGYNDAPLTKRWNGIKAVKAWLDETDAQLAKGK